MYAARADVRRAASATAEAAGRWPADVAAAIKELYTGLCIKKKRFRLKLPDVLGRLRALLQAAPALTDEPATCCDAARRLGRPLTLALTLPLTLTVT